jgi:phosphate/sulfate permease
MLKRLIPQQFDFFTNFNEAAGLALDVILAGLIGAIAWDLLTWYVGLPFSSSHALLGLVLIAIVMFAFRKTAASKVDRLFRSSLN